MKCRPPGRYPNHRPPRGGARTPSPRHTMARPGAGDSWRPGGQRLGRLSSCTLFRRRHRRRSLHLPCPGVVRSQCPSSPPSFSPAGNSTHARRALARSAMATEQRGFYRIVSADFAVCRCVHPNDRLWMDFVGHNVQSAIQQRIQSRYEDKQKSVLHRTETVKRTAQGIQV